MSTPLHYAIHLPEPPAPEPTRCGDCDNDAEEGGRYCTECRLAMEAEAA